MTPVLPAVVAKQQLRLALKARGKIDLRRWRRIRPRHDCKNRQNRCNFFNCDGGFSAAIGIVLTTMASARRYAIELLSIQLACTTREGGPQFASHRRHSLLRHSPQRRVRRCLRRSPQNETT